MSEIETFACSLDEAGVGRLGELLAFKLRAGDLVLLEGDLGAGKTTLARALVRAAIGDPAAEVASPTFPLVQAYATPRMPVLHADLYRLAAVRDLDELGLEEALPASAVLVEWPDRAPQLRRADRIEVQLAAADDPQRRRVTVTGFGTAAARVRRIGELDAFIAALAPWAEARISYMQGDASQRAYARLVTPHATAILMDAPRQPDGPPVRDGRPYSRIAHLAEDVRPFVAIADALRGAGLAAPEILAHDLARRRRRPDRGARPPARRHRSAASRRPPLPAAAL